MHTSGVSCPRQNLPNSGSLEEGEPQLPKIKAKTIAEHKKLSRAALLDAAFDLFSSRGYAGTSLTDITSLADVGRTTIYEYFTDKEEIFLAVIDSRVPNILTEAVGRLTETEPAARMRQLFEVGWEVTINNIATAAILFRVGRELPSEVRDRMWRALGPVTNEVFRLCHEGVTSGVFRGEPELLAQSVADLLVGGIDQLLAQEDIEDAAPAILAQRLAFLEHGLG